MPTKSPDEGTTVDELRRRWPTLEILNASQVRREDRLLGLTGGPAAATVICDHLWDMLNLPRTLPVLRCYTSSYQQSQHGETGVVTGMPGLDAVQKRITGWRGVWAVYGPKWRVGRPWTWPWVHRLLSWPLFALQFTMIRQEARRQDVRLVLKTRAKDHTPRAILRMADEIVTDSDLYPHRGLDLCQSVDLVIHWQSGVVFEAAAVGVPQVALRTSHDYLAGYPWTSWLYESTRLGFPFVWPGVVETVSTRRLRDALTNADVDRDQLTKYRDVYCGPLDGESGKRVIETVVSQKP